MPVNAKPLGESAYQFRFYRDRRAYFECDTMQEWRDELRAYCPWNTVYRAISQGGGFYVVLMLSPYVIGPQIEGYLWVRD